jgi:hypothetical protein
MLLRKITLFLLSSIVTMLAKIQDENKQKQEKRSDEK